MSTRIIIVGAGMSGLSAAERLIQHGFKNIKILEASDRIGGRIQTSEFGNGWIELGAQWIHGEENNVIYDYARQHNLLADHHPSFELNDELFHTEDGDTINASLCEHMCDVISSQLAKIKSKPELKEQSTVEGYLNNAVQDEVSHSSSAEESATKRALLQWYKKLQCSIEACNTLSEMSVQSFANYIECEGNPLTNLKRGFSSVVNSIAKQIPNSCIILNKFVSRIQLKRHLTSDSGHAVRILCSDDSCYEADHVIVTVSLGVLKRHINNMFEPQLSLAKQQAIQMMGFGTVDKIFLEFASSFWKKDASGYSLVWMHEVDDETTKHNITTSWPISVFGFYTVPFASNVLCGWLSGSEARHMETLNDAEVLNTCIELLRRFTGKSELPKVTRMLRSRWYSSPYTVGSYSYLKKELPCTTVANDVLAEPVFNTKDGKQYPAILFAGEATHRSYYSTVHGARESGLREADRIVELYAKSIPSQKL